MIRKVSFSVVAMAVLFQQAAAVGADLKTQAVEATAAYARQHLAGDRLVKLGIEEDKKFELQTSCQSEYRIAPLGLQVVLPAEFTEGKTDPVKGAWLIRYRLERCGESKVYNALFVAQDGDVPAMQSFYPGSTKANANLLHDAMPAALTQASGASTKRGCKTPYVYDMQVKTPLRDVEKSGAIGKDVWEETWTFSLCGELIDVPMTFTPDSDGSGASFRGHKATIRSGTQ
jgi:hypothetical protein